MFKQKIEIVESATEAKGNCGNFIIKQAKLVSK
jgi:hypothetical protein